MIKKILTSYATIICDRITSGKIIFNIHATFTEQSLQAHIINGNIQAETDRRIKSTIRENVEGGEEGGVERTRRGKKPPQNRFLKE